MLKLTPLLALLALMLAGCAATPEDRYVQSERGLQAFAKTFKAAVEGDAIKDPNQIRAGIAIIQEWNAANKELNLARLNGEGANVDFWLDRLESIVLRAAEWGS